MANKVIYQKFTIWQMFRDIFVTAINKGQLPATILGLLLVIFAIRMPIEDLKQFALLVVQQLTSGYLFGYFMFIITLLGWFFHAKRLRRRSFEEHERIGKEKSELQKTALPGKVKSSKR
jgi:hypothetical protein